MNTNETTNNEVVNNNVNVEQPVSTTPVSPVVEAATPTEGVVVDPTISSGATRTNAPTTYASTTENVKAVPITPGQEKLLLKSKDSISLFINKNYNKLFVYNSLCPHCKKYFFVAAQPDNVKVRCPNCLEDNVISKFKETKSEFNLELSEKLLFAGLATIVLGFFLYVDQFIKFFSWICLGLIMCIPKLKLEFNFDRKKCLYAALVLFILPLILSLLLFKK